MQFSPGGRTFLDVHSTVDRPYATDLRRADGSTIARLEVADTASLAALGHRPPEPFTARAADGTTVLHGVIYTPADFDPSRRYPVVDYIYGGAFLSAVQKEYAPTLGMQRIAASLAQMGLVVVMVDARGTPGRDKAFQDATYGRVGQMEIADHVAALRQAAESRPWMDLSRAGIAGHSWGGYFALRGMLTAPEFFRAGYAGAPGDLTELAVINEPHMGMPAENPEGYERGSNLPLAANLAGPLKIMHGTSDVNAPFSTTMRMISAFIAAGPALRPAGDPRWRAQSAGPGRPILPAGPAALHGDATAGNREQGIGNSPQRRTPNPDIPILGRSTPPVVTS